MFFFLILKSPETLSEEKEKRKKKNIKKDDCLLCPKAFIANHVSFIEKRFHVRQEIHFIGVYLSTCPTLKSMLIKLIEF